MIALLALATADPLAPLTPPATEAHQELIIRRGEPVTLLVRSGALTIATAARALGDARQGQRVRIVTLATRRTLDGVAQAPGEVRLPLP